MNIEIQVYDRELQDLLKRMVERGGDLSPVMRDISVVLRDGIERAFAQERDPQTGQPWAPLHPLTIREREAAGNWPGKILQRTGRLVSSINPDHGPDFAAAGTTVFYAAIQHFGGVIRPRNKRALRFGGGFFGSATIPARPFAGIWPDSIEEISDLLAAFVVDGNNGGAGR